MATRAVIIEDEPFARQTLREFLAEVDWVELIGEADNGPDAVRLLDHLRPQLVFLDVQIPGLSGLRVLEQIDYEPAVIFTTAHDEYAVRAFEFGAIDYLLKPFGRARFRKTLDRVRARLEAVSVERSEKLTRLFVRDRERILPVSIDDISRLEAADDYVLVHAKGGKFMVGLTLNHFERRLPADRFRRVHRSHIINLDCVISIEPFDRRLLIRMRDGSEVLASRAASQLLRDLIA
ncbi:MAG: LytTR family DNA-binding domain-containing protein [Acidobacteriota bacterium]